MQTVQTLFRRRVLWRLIRVLTVYQRPFYGMQGSDGLSTEQIWAWKKKHVVMSIFFFFFFFVNCLNHRIQINLL